MKVLIPNFERVYEDFGEVLGVDKAIPVEVEVHPVLLAVLNKVVTVRFMGWELPLRLTVINVGVKGEKEAILETWWKHVSLKYQVLWDTRIDSFFLDEKYNEQEYHATALYYARMFEHPHTSQAEETLLLGLRGTIEDILLSTLKDKGMSYQEFIDGLLTAFVNSFESVDFDSVLEALRRRIPKTAKIIFDAEKTRSEIEDLEAYSISSLFGYLDLYGKFYVLMRDGRPTENFGLYGSSAHRMLFLVSRLHREYVRKTYSEMLKALDVEISYHLEKAKSASALGTAALSTGDVPGWIALRSIATISANNASILASRKRALLESYRSAMIKAYQDGPIEVPIPLADALTESDIAVIPTLLPVITKIKLRGSRSEGMLNVFLTPGGVGLVPLVYVTSDYEFKEYHYSIYHPEKHNGVKNKNPIPCAYGDGLVPKDIIKDKKAVCSVCTVPLCPRHAHVIEKRTLFITRKKIYCPEHAHGK